MSDFNELNRQHDRALQPPDEAPVTECNGCGSDLFAGQDAHFAYFREPVVFCSEDCAIEFFGVRSGTIGVDGE